jgi:hypothetical protein
MNPYDFVLNEPYLALGLTIQLMALAVMAGCFLKFQKTSQVFGTLQRQWASAESSHHRLVSEARDHVSRLAFDATPAPARPRLHLGAETRNHVLSLSRKGVSPEDIAHACGIPQSAVRVMLGFARLEQTRRK